MRRTFLIAGGLAVLLAACSDGQTTTSAESSTSTTGEAVVATSGEPPATTEQPAPTSTTREPTTTSTATPRLVEDGAREVFENDYGDEWPLTVESGILRCSGDAVTFEAPDGTVYAVNGMATTRDEGVEIEPIWRPNPELADVVPEARIDIGPLIDDGLELC